MPIIVFVGGTADTETIQVASAATSQITLPPLDGVPEETYARIDPYDQPVVRFALTTTTTEGSPA